jgi:hypothetical protein
MHKVENVVEIFLAICVARYTKRKEVVLLFAISFKNLCTSSRDSLWLFALGRKSSITKSLVHGQGFTNVVAYIILIDWLCCLRKLNELKYLISCTTAQDIAPESR